MQRIEKICDCGLTNLESVNSMILTGNEGIAAMPTEQEIAWQLDRMDEGATREDAIAVLEESEQEFTCPICRAPSDFCRDHTNHKTEWF